MERKPHRATAWLSLVFAVACQPVDETPDTTYEEPNENAAGAAARLDDQPDTLLTVALRPADSAVASAVSGEVSIVAGDEADDPLELVVRGTGLPPGEHGWHVHSGPCGTTGPVRIPLSATADDDGITGPIDANDDGEFDQTVEVPELNRTMVGTQEHSLHIHRNAGADHGPTVACATI